MPERLEIVACYLRSFRGEIHDWILETIRSPSVFSYSLFLHEYVEIMSYLGQGLDPFDEDEQVEHYDACHAPALLVEFAFLDAAHRMVYEQSAWWTRLMRYHPAALKARPEIDLDLEMLESWCPQHNVNMPDDTRLQDWVCKIYDFYRTIGWRDESECLPNCRQTCPLRSLATRAKW